MPAPHAGLSMLTASAWATQLRLNKVSELIHNSEHHRNLDMAQVSVHFQEIVDTVRASPYPAAFRVLTAVQVSGSRVARRQAAGL